MENFVGPGPVSDAGREWWDDVAKEEIAEVTSGDYSGVRPLHEELGLEQSDVDEVDAETLRDEPLYEE